VTHIDTAGGHNTLSTPVQASRIPPGVGIPTTSVSYENPSVGVRRRGRPCTICRASGKQVERALEHAARRMPGWNETVKASGMRKTTSRGNAGTRYPSSTMHRDAPSRSSEDTPEQPGTRGDTRRRERQ